MLEAQPTPVPPEQAEPEVVPPMPKIEAPAEVTLPLPEPKATEKKPEENDLRIGAGIIWLLCADSQSS